MQVALSAIKEYKEYMHIFQYTRSIGFQPNDSGTGGHIKIYDLMTPNCRKCGFLGFPPRATFQEGEQRLRQQAPLYRRCLRVSY